MQSPTQQQPGKMYINIILKIAYLQPLTELIVLTKNPKNP